MAYFLLDADETYLRDLSQQIGALKSRIHSCRVCGAFTETPVCEYCTDSKRDGSILCVLEQSQDIQIIESTGEFRGRYHILGGVLNPLEGVGPDDLNIRSLINRLGNESVEEVIIATNPTVEGDTTGLYLVKLIKPLGIKVTRLASGLPVGGDIEYADKLTLARSLRSRSQLEL